MAYRRYYEKIRLQFPFVYNNKFRYRLTAKGIALKNSQTNNK